MRTYYIILDLEMNPVAANHPAALSGLYRETIEIGAVKIDAGTNRIVSEFSRLICPECNSRIEPVITRLTGITTQDVSGAGSFGNVLADFVSWIGQDPVRIYSWSNSDLLQLEEECRTKQIPLPAVLEDWVDFQAEFPSYLGMTDRNCLSLKNAARMIGTPMSGKKAHRALYDAQVTGQLVIFVYSGAYRHYTSAVSQTKSAMTYSLGDACGGKLAALLAKMNEREDSPYAEGYRSPNPAYIR